MKNNYLFRSFTRAFIAWVAGVCTTFAVSSSALCQINGGGTPPSFSLNLSSSSVPDVTLSPLDNSALIADDEAEYTAANQAGLVIPYRIARPQDVSLNLNNSGTWEVLSNGDRVWRLRIVSPGATDLWLIYDQWRITKPCELYLYNDDRTMVLGPYTSIDNWDGTNVTPITTGDAVTLEYIVPADQEDIGELSVMRVLHGYRHFNNREARERDALDAFGDALPCEINVNCFGNMQEEKRAVALIADPMGGTCSGTMLNNTLQNGDPLFLTANHCLNGSVNNWLFYFNYESALCSPNTDGSAQFVVSNATLLMSHALTDHALLRLSRPRPNTPYIPAYMGWYRVDTPASTSYGIHHPRGDVKKAHEDYGAATSTDWNGVGPNTHWRTTPDNGTSEGGSSGSPMINTDGRVVGPLHGGVPADCDPGTQETAVYGKLSGAWEGDGFSNGRLRDWLDPTNSGATLTNYWQPFGPPNDSCGPGVPLISALPYSNSGSTLFAANNFNTASGCQQNNSPEVLYLFQFPCDYQVTVSTCGSNFDTQLFILQVGECMQWFTSAGCNDDFCGTQSQVSFTAASGIRYLVVLEGYATAWGDYVLNVTGQPVQAQPTGLCPGTNIGYLPYFTYTDNYCAQDDHICSCQPNGGNDVVYNWVAIYSQQMRAKTCNTNFDTVLEVIQGGNCVSGGSIAGCNDDACGSSGLGSSVSFFPLTGATYWFHIDGYYGAEGTTSFQLEVANDDCSSPFVLTDVPTFSTGDTRPARDDFATVVGPASKEVFFQYTSPTCQNLSFSTCGMNGFDTAVEVRTGGPCPGSTLVTYSDDACGVQSNAVWGADANRTYYIIVGGFNLHEGPFWYNFETHPNPLPHLGDVCTGIQIPSLPFTDYGSTTCMAANYSNCVTQSSREMVYQFSLSTCQDVTVSLCGSNYDTELGIYGGVCPNIAPLIVCDDDNYCGPNYVLQSTATFTAEANTNYQILIHGYSSNYGNFAINVTGTPCPPPAPPPVADLVAQYDPASGDVVLAWSAAAGADVYHVYRASNSETLFEAQNVIATVSELGYICVGCVNDPDPVSFFGVIADNQLALVATPPRDISMLTKADAVQGPIMVSADDSDFTPEEVQVSANKSATPK